MPNKFRCTDWRRDWCTLYQLHIQENLWNGRPNSKQRFFYDSETEIEAFLPPGPRRNTKVKLAPIHKDRQNLVSNLDEQGKDDDDEQVVKNANSSHDDVDDLECKVTDVHQIQLQRIIFRRRGRREVVPDISRQRCVLHRCQQLSPSPASVIYRLYISCWSI